MISKHISYKEATYSRTATRLGIENKPDEDLISILNDNDGFAMWIDDSILEKIDREIYEFMFFVKNDVKVARTHDKKIMIINCKIDKGKTWIIEEEFYL